MGGRRDYLIGRSRNAIGAGVKHRRMAIAEIHRVTIRHRAGLPEHIANSVAAVETASRKHRGGQHENRPGQ
jgi:hypothetical protein